MANNRLWLVDQTSGDQFMLAKTMGAGWYHHAALEPSLWEWLEGRDEAASWGNATGNTVLTLRAENDEDDGVRAQRDALLAWLLKYDHSQTVLALYNERYGKDV